MKDKIIFSLKTAIVGVIISLIILWVVSLFKNIELINFLFPVGIFCGNFAYGMFAFEKEKNKILFLILAVFIWMISIYCVLR